MRSGQEAPDETANWRNFAVRIDYRLTLGAEPKKLGTAIARATGASVTLRLNLDDAAIKSVVDARLEQVFRRRLCRRIESDVLAAMRDNAMPWRWSEQDCIGTLIQEVP